MIMPTLCLSERDMAATCFGALRLLGNTDASTPVSTSQAGRLD